MFCYLIEKLLIRRCERRSLGPELLAEDRAGREMGPEGERERGGGGGCKQRIVVQAGPGLRRGPGRSDLVTERFVHQ